MNEYQKEAILISFLNEKERYKRLAERIIYLISDDPSSPKEILPPPGCPGRVDGR